MRGIKDKLNIVLSCVIAFLLSSCGFVEETNFLTNTSSAPSGPPWWDTSWSNRRQVTFDNSAQTEDLVDFPVLIKLDNSRIDYNKTQNSGQDIRFLDDDGTTELSYEIELWDEGGESCVWVKVPQIDGSSDTDSIWIYYGNNNAGDNQNGQDVWDGNYIAVWHFGEGGTGTRYDSTSNTNDGTPMNYDGDEATTGKIGNTDQFDGASNYLEYPNDTSLNTSDTITMSAWVYGNSYATNDIIVHRSAAYGFWYDWTGSSIDNNEIQFMFYDGATWRVCDSDFTPNTGTWYYFSATYNNSSQEGKFYINDSLQKTNSYSQSINSGTVLRIGGWNSGNYFFNGSIDEVRISNIDRSADWISAQYLSMNDSFLTFGDEQ